jgi:hypothetical protein
MTSLISTVPELQLIYEEHIRNNDEILPHVFLGDVARFAVEAALDIDKQNVLKRLLECMEDGLDAGSADVRELILASFVENLLGEENAVRRLKLLMGPKMRAAVVQTLGA